VKDNPQIAVAVNHIEHSMTMEEIVSTERSAVRALDGFKYLLEKRRVACILEAVKLVGEVR
jgi:hypothetical protein